MKILNYVQSLLPSISKDTILDNGSCIQVLNRINMSFNTLMIARKTFNKLLKDGNLVQKSFILKIRLK